MNDYRLDHSAPADDGYSSPLPDILKRFGPDVLDRPDLYGNCDDETLEQMRAAVADPDGTVRIYRAVPPDHLEINGGDWVTLSRGYAHDHGYVDDGPDWPVVFADVPARQVWTDGNDPSEYGYNGTAHVDLTGYAEGEPIPPPPARVPPLVTDHEESAGFSPSRGAQAFRRQPPSVSGPNGSPHRGR